jgi:xylulokinase
MYLLGYDLGSSFLKACLLDGDTGKPVAVSSRPGEEMEMSAPRAGWAEQDPELWWKSLKEATGEILAKSPAGSRPIGAIGIAYQMHGLVLVGQDLRVLRPSIIWCDSRAVGIGRRAFREIGEERCLGALLNSPGNFTASKLRWVKENEPQTFARAHKMMLPGDYLALRLTGRVSTTVSGLSEAMLWDFEKNCLARFLLEHYRLPAMLVPEIVPTFGDQGRLTPSAARELGLPEGIPVAYRAGDQPNNGLSLGVLEPGEVAATAGTSGVVYAVSGSVRFDPRSRVNGFAHVNHDFQLPRLGLLLCINGTGIANRWARSLAGRAGWSYEQIDSEAARIRRGAEGAQFFPFGNGAERMLEGRDVGAHFCGLNFNLHTASHLLRAVQEGVACSFKYGMDILGEIGIEPRVIRAGLGNMFLSPLFRETLAGTTGVAIELYHSDGARGAAIGAGLGCGHYANPAEALAGLERRGILEPATGEAQEYAELYQLWATRLKRFLT